MLGEGRCHRVGERRKTAQFEPTLPLRQCFRSLGRERSESVHDDWSLVLAECTGGLGREFIDAIE